jgi:DNA-binding NtrC family response regulator
VKRDDRYPPFSVLLVDDEAPWLRTLSMTLEGQGGITRLMTCLDARKVSGLLASEDVGLILLDINMPHVSGERLLERLREEHPDITVIVVSGLNQVETAVNCMRLGAFDYIVKGAGSDRLLDTIHRAIRFQELERENRAMRQQLLGGRPKSPEAFADIVTVDPSMQRIFRYSEAIAASPRPVLITGESGTGKELVARAVHKLSGRSGELVSVNIAGLDDSVFADTLFGHVRGAFTGADTARAGLVEKAAGGTLFLDEIGDLSQASQVKLLRLLQEGEYFALGDDRPRLAKIRVIVATHNDLAARQETGDFRRDLYYRLCSHHLHLPPLRERLGDIPLLLDYFLDDAARTLGKPKPTPPPQLRLLLANYAFPGNVRELQSMAFDAVSNHLGGVLSMAVFQRAIASQLTVTRPAAGMENPFALFEQCPSLAEAVQLLIEDAMRRSEGNQTLAARMLGISQPALSKRLRQIRD